MFIPASGWLGDRFGGKRMLLAAIVVFTVASALCGLASSLGELVLFRVLQGVGGGMLAPVGMAMLFRAFPPEERIRASSILTVPTTLAPALGPGARRAAGHRPVLALGLLRQRADRRRGVHLRRCSSCSRPSRPTRAGSTCPASCSPDSASGCADVRACPRARSRAGTRPTCWPPSRPASCCWPPWWSSSCARPQPMVDLRLLGNRLFRSSNGVMVLASIAFLGTLYAISLYYQDGRGLSALDSGLSTFPEAFGVMGGAQLASRWLYPRLGPRRHVTIGLVGTAVVHRRCSRCSGRRTSLWWARLLMFTLGLSMGQIFVPLQAAAFATITPAATGRASTMFNAVRQLGGAVGVAVLTTAIVLVGPVHLVGRARGGEPDRVPGRVPGRGRVLPAGCAVRAVDPRLGRRPDHSRPPRRPAWLRLPQGLPRPAGRALESPPLESPSRAAPSLAD